MKIEQRRLDAIQEHPENPRQHPEGEIKKLMGSIRSFGWTNPILVSREGYIVAGHARAEAARRLGLREVPVVELDMDGDKALAYLLADNRLQEDSQWDMELLETILAGLGDTDLLLATGFDTEETESILGVFGAEEFKRPTPAEILGEVEIVEEEPPAASPEEPKRRTWEEKKGAYPTGNWLTVIMYGQDMRFAALKDRLETRGLMITGHEVNPEFFYQAVMAAAGGEED